MIKFFRKIRQKLLSENKFSKYLVYAIGEIVLVVIGILIALQINNWNELQKLNEKEISIAKELCIELTENLISVKSQLGLWENRGEKILEVISLIESENVKLTNTEFDSTLIYVIGFSNFRLKKSKFQRIISLENFEFKKSPMLINELLELNDMYITLMDYYSRNNENYNQFLWPYLINNYSIENFANVFTGKRAKSRVDYHELLSDLKFANIIHSARGENAPFVKRIKITIKKIESLITQLETIYPSLNDR